MNHFETEFLMLLDRWSAREKTSNIWKGIIFDSLKRDAIWITFCRLRVKKSTQPEQFLLLCKFLVCRNISSYLVASLP